MSFPMERDVEDLLQLVLAGENAAAEMAEARTAMEDFMVRSRVVTLSEGRRQQDPIRDRDPRGGADVPDVSIRCVSVDPIVGPDYSS